MNENQFMGMLVVALIMLAGFYWSIKREIVASEDRRQKPVNDLIVATTKLDSTIQMINSTTKSLEQRVAVHGQEIDRIREQNAVHENRIGTLEKHCDAVKK